MAINIDIIHVYYIYAINKPPHQLPYSHDIRVYGFNGGHPGTAYVLRTLHNMPL